LTTEPLCVTAELLDGRVATTDLQLPLDGLLAYAWIARYHPAALEVTRSGLRAAEVIVAELPLARRGMGDDWYWAASWAFGEPQREQYRWMHKRFDEGAAIQYADWQGRRATLNVASGLYKNRRKPETVFVVPYLRWYVMGDAAALEDLLREIVAIGKKRGSGLGRVRRWTVARASEDRSDARAVPDATGEDVQPIRPPYWWPAHRRRVRWPMDPDLACNWLRTGQLAESPR
jgi:CRISPR type IV-associated protein Csf3